MLPCYSYSLPLATSYHVTHSLTLFPIVAMLAPRPPDDVAGRVGRGLAFQGQTEACLAPGTTRATPRPAVASARVERERDKSSPAGPLEKGPSRRWVVPGWQAWSRVAVL